MTAAALLQLGSAIVVNASFSWMIGALLVRCWLRGAHCGRPIVAMLQRSTCAAAGLCLLGSGAALWAAAAVMSDASLPEAIGMLGMVLFETAVGRSGLLGLALLLAIGGLGLFAHRAPACDLAQALLLFGFAASRAALSHAAENGMLSLGFAIEWLHLVLIAAWIGGVAVAAWLVLPVARTIPAAPDQHKALCNYLKALSQAAGLALAGIVATGLYSAWQRLGALDHLFGNSYGNALTVKLALVALAVGLGGYNKWRGFPSVGKSAQALPSVIAILRVESALLFAALIAAAVLTSQQPPATF